MTDQVRQFLGRRASERVEPAIPVPPPMTEPRFKSMRLKAKYVGEQKGLWIDDRSFKPRYLKPRQREAYRVIIQNGLIYDSRAAA